LNVTLDDFLDGLTQIRFNVAEGTFHAGIPVWAGEIRAGARTAMPCPAFTA
jgi:hypothetical protein